MSANSGMWVVAITHQGGGIPDTVEGPYWSEGDAIIAAAEMSSEALPRHDLYEVYLMTGDYS